NPGIGRPNLADCSPVHAGNWRTVLARGRHRGELRLRLLDASQRFAVLAPRFPPHGERNAGLRHQVALVRGIDEDLPGKLTPTLHKDPGYAVVVHRDAGPFAKPLPPEDRHV